MNKLKNDNILQEDAVTHFRIREFLKNSLSIQRISYMTVFTAASVALVLIVNTFVPIMIIQSFRVAFAGVFVKASGLLLGPIVGALSGLLTDLFLLMLRPTDYHPGYTLVLILFGFFSGLAFFIREKNKNKSKSEAIFLITFLFIIVIGVAESFIITSSAPDTIQLFNLSFLELSALQTVALLCGGLFICLTGVVFTRLKFDKDRVKMNDILIIILLNVFIDFLISQPLISYFDQFSSIQAVPYSSLFISRIGSSSLTIIWNSLLIFIMWKVLFPIVNRRLHK